MDSFFNYDYADEVAETISKMDEDTAQMFSLFVAHDVLHQHIEDNRRTVSKRVNEILGEIEDTAMRLYGDDPEAAEFLEMVSEVSKSGERKVRTNAGAQYYDLPIGSVIRARSKPNNYDVRVKHKDGQSRVKVKYTGPKDNWQRRDFDLVSALGSAEKKGNAFEQKWNDPGKHGTSEGTYNRVAAGSRLVRDVGLATGSPSIATAGAVGNFAGSFGPSAEKVIGPSMRKTAYRFRGTEKAVDPELIAAARNEVRLQMRDQGMERLPLTSSQQRALTTKANQLYKEQPKGEGRKSMTEIRREVFAQAQRTQNTQRKPLSPEQRSDITRATAVAHLSNKLPSAKLSALQAASGKIPPSEGVIISASGHPVAQAVGYQEDHFLPFNLKNLKALNGGSYVRTRSSGGLTTEDIYTGLMTGARSVTVVSRSGVFTVDFADDFRGVRRYGDVAHGMVERYGKILDAVQSRQVERSPLSGMEKAQIRADVESEMGHLANTREGRRIIEEAIEEEIQEARRSVEPTLREMEEIERKTDEIVNTPDISSRWGGERSTPLPKDPEVRRNYVRSELIDEFRADKQDRMHKLDGVGYETALKALQEQYPYFISNVTRTDPYKDGERRVQRSRETDTGYVRPNYLRPKEVKEGYFDPEIEGFSGGIKTRDGKATGKYSAASTNYQNYRHSGSRQEASESEDTPKTDAPKSLKSRTDKTRRDVSSNAELKIKAEDDLDNHYAKMAALLAGEGKETDFTDVKAFLGGEDPNSEEGKRKLTRAMRDPNNKKVVDAAMTRAMDSATGSAKATLDSLARTKENLQGRITEVSMTELPEDFSESPRFPAPFKDIPEGKNSEFYGKLISDVGRGYDFDVGDDMKMRNASDASLALSRYYERISDQEEIPDTVIEDIRRIARDDPSLVKESKEAARLTPDSARFHANRHRKRALAIERARRAYAEFVKASVAEGVYSPTPRKAGEL